MIRTSAARAWAIRSRYPAISAAAGWSGAGLYVGRSTSLNPMSFSPTRTITERTPGRSSTSRRKRLSARSPNHAESLSSRFPPMPWLSTGLGIPAAASRSASASG